MSGDYGTIHRQIHAAISQVEVHEVDHEALHRVRRITVTYPARSSQCGASPQSSRVQYAVARYVGTGAPATCTHTRSIVAA